MTEYLAAPDTRFTERRLSPSASFEVHPDIQATGVLSQLNPRELRLAQLTYNVFHIPYNQTARNYYDLETAETALRNLHDVAGGYKGMATGFKAFRRLGGEESFGGLELVEQDSDDITPLDPYLRILGKRGLAVSGYQGHHDMFHGPGALLAIDEIATMMQLDAQTVKRRFPELTTHEHPREKVDAAQRANRITFFIRLLWKCPGDYQVYAPFLGGYLDQLIRVTPEADKGRTGPEIAAAQMDFLVDLQSRAIFVDPRELASEAATSPDFVLPNGMMKP